VIRLTDRARTLGLAVALITPLVLGCENTVLVGGPGVLTATLESPNGAEGAALLHAFWNIQNTGDLGITKAFELLQHDDLSVLVSDVSHSLPKGLVGFSSLSQPFRVGPSTRGTELKSLISRLETSARLSTADYVTALVPENLEEPRTKGTVGVEPVERLPSLDEGVLKGVAGLVGASQHSDGESKPRSLIGAH
jgi:hypothetical protein